MPNQLDLFAEPSVTSAPPMSRQPAASIPSAAHSSRYGDRTPERVRDMRELAVIVRKAGGTERLASSYETEAREIESELAATDPRAAITRELQALEINSPEYMAKLKELARCQKERAGA